MKGFFSRYWRCLLFGLFAFGLNVSLGFLARHENWPLFLTSIGTLLAGAFCGAPLGLIVGVATLATLTSFDVNAVYYSFYGIFLGYVIGFLSSRRILKHPLGVLLTYLAVSGILFSSEALITYYWRLDNPSTDALFMTFVHSGWQPIPAEFMAFFIVVFADNFISFFVLSCAMVVFPDSWKKRLSLGYVYLRSPLLDLPEKDAPKRGLSIADQLIGISVTTHLIAIIVFSTVFYGFYAQKAYDNIADTNDYCSVFASTVVPYDKVQTFLEDPTGESWDNDTSRSFAIMNKGLRALMEDPTHRTDIASLSVFAKDGDNCTVIFQKSNDDASAHHLGDVISVGDLFLTDALFDYSNLANQNAMIHVVDWELLSLTPVLNANRAIVAYVLSVGSIVETREAITQLFVAFNSFLVVLAVAFVIVSNYVATKTIAGPINSIIHQASDFVKIGPATWLESKEWQDRERIHSRNEIETLGSVLDEAQLQLSHYYHDLMEESRKFALMEKNVINSYSFLIDSRDKTTGHHNQRTSRLIELLAQEARKKDKFASSLNNEFVEHLILAAPLHDIGKAVIPDTILNKPGPLTSEEFAIMKTHTTEGKKILASALKDISGTPYLLLAEELAYTHHEKWDGTGYPLGLVKEEIPLSGRLMAVVDVFDALTSKRPYKEAFSFEKAYGIILAETGTNFDPDIVDCFMKIPKEQLAAIVQN